MNKISLYFAVAALSLLSFSCQKAELTSDSLVSQEVIDKVTLLGFNPDGIMKTDRGYLVERDIVLTEENLNEAPTVRRVPGMEQYHTNNLVSTGGSRDISVYLDKKFSSTYSAALDEAIARYNAEGLQITFSRARNRKRADISMSRLGRIEEQLGVLGSAGFPSGGDPYNEILMSGILESGYGLDVNGIATIIAHEMGHCIGFRHTDYFDRSISCGGSPSDEGDGGVGANHIPGTPTDALLSDLSWMLSCTDGGDRPFNGDDQVALDYLY